jgi:F-type H+-transporting ATPase subunit gamma
MASTIILLRRIRTAQNVSKTTRAMQMIAASKLKKAQDAALTSRPYVEKLSSVSRHLTKRVDKPSLPAYMKANTAGEGRTLIVAISPDKGLCGGLVTNLAREVLLATTKNDKIVTVGKKIEGPVSRLSDQLVAAFPFGNTLPAFSVVYPIIEIINEQFLSGKVDKVEIISTHFENIFTQKPHKTKLLPILSEEMAEDTSASGPKEKNLSDKFQLFEPDLETILPDLLKRYIEMVLYQEILESYLSEQAARMLAMQNATNNARDIIEDLKLEYNKTRQAKITSEILDITSAASSSAKTNGIGKKLENLVQASYKNGQLDKDTADFIASKLTRNDLKLYIKLLDQEENKKQVFVTASTQLDKASQEKIQHLFPDKKVVYAIDPSMISGIKVVENDVEFEINLNRRFHDIIQFLSKND